MKLKIIVLVTLVLTLLVIGMFVFAYLVQQENSYEQEKISEISN